MTLEERADKIADKANECCYRSDGWKEELANLISAQIREAIYEAQEQWQSSDRILAAHKAVGFQEAKEKAIAISGEIMDSVFALPLGTSLEQAREFMKKEFADRIREMEP